MVLRTGAGTLKQIFYAFKANALFLQPRPIAGESAQPPTLFARNLPRGRKTALQSQNTRKKDLHLKKRCAIIFKHYARRCRAGRVPL